MAQFNDYRIVAGTFGDPGADGDPIIIHGSTQQDGAAGWTIAGSATGIYTITFSPAFTRCVAAFAQVYTQADQAAYLVDVTTQTGTTLVIKNYLMVDAEANDNLNLTAAYLIATGRISFFAIMQP